MIAQLAAARDSLCSALERYLSVCLAIDKSCVRYSPQDAFPELTSALSGELALVSSYEKTLLEAKLALSLARNRSTRVVPISRLTTDVLVRIFQLVTAESNCSARDPKETHKHVFPTYPHLLTGVCSQWRQVVTSSTYLWSHIDIPCPFSCDETTLNRMKEYIARSGASLLDVHIMESDNPQMIAPMGVGALTRVLAPLSTRIRSLELKLSASPMRPLGPLATSGIIGYSMIFSTCFSNCAAETLKRLAICAVESTTPCTFIAAAFSNPGRNSRALGAPRQSLVSLSVPEKILEDLWLPVTVLNLKGFYPRWSSKAYHGLVELRLGATGAVSISQSELVIILKSSPQLRILDFSLSITNTSSRNTPVRLEDLETLVVGERTPDQLGHLLCLIAPGSRALSVSLRQPGGRYTGLFGLEVQKFFARANVEIIGVSGTYRYPQVIELLRLIPDVRALALSGTDFGEVNWYKHKPTSTGSCLHDLYLLQNTVITQTDLLHMIEAYRIQRLVVVKDCVITDARKTLIPDNRMLQEQAASLGLEFEFIPTGGPHPIKEWDWSS